MHLKFTSFDTHYIFYIRRGRMIIYLQFPPRRLTFKHVEEKKLWIRFTWTVWGR